MQRNKWMDFTRGVCILLVLALHASAALSDNGLATPGLVRSFNLLFEPFRMPLLMFLSGMLLERSLLKPTKNYIGGKLAKIYWPFLLWSMIVLAAENRLTLEAILKTPISAPTLLWYLWFLCAYHLIALGMQRFSVPIVPVVALSLVGSELLPDVLRASRFAYLFAFFLLGHLAASSRLSMSGKGPLAIFGFILAVFGAVLSSRGWETRYNALYVWAPFGMILLLLWLSPFYLRTFLGDKLEWVGRNSIVFYVVHFPVQIMTARAIASKGELNSYVSYVIVLVSGLVLGAVLQIMRRRHSVVAGLFDFRQMQRVLDYKWTLIP